MMAQYESERESFQSTLEQLYHESGSSDSLHKIRAKGWERLLELGLPTRKTEVYRYIKLRSLFSENYIQSAPRTISAETIAQHIYPECQGSVLVFVNGHFMPSLSQMSALPPKLIISTLVEASRTYSALLNNHWTKAMKEETDSFVAVNAALQSDGAFLYITPKTIIEQPLQILHLIDTRDQPMMLLPRLHVFAGAQSQTNIAVSHVCLSGTHYFINGATDVTLDEAANVRLTQSTLHDSPDVWHFDALRVSLKRNANFTSTHVTNGGQTVRNDYRIALLGENSEAALNGLCMLGGKREAHANVLIDHQAPRCRSMQLFKGVLNDVSRSSFEGKIFVRQAAQKTEAFQLNKNLLLGERCHADSKPNLEIFADDVKASHGATIGQLDKEQLFYLTTRGIPPRIAKGMLVHGFYQDVIEQIPLLSMRNEAMHKLCLKS
jgi:Fe-S cluster assembly protein SufD